MVVLLGRSTTALFGRPHLQHHCARHAVVSAAVRHGQPAAARDPDAILPTSPLHYASATSMLEARPYSSSHAGQEEAGAEQAAVLKEFAVTLHGDLQSMCATLLAGIGVITWWRGIWCLLDCYVGTSEMGGLVCAVAGLLIILLTKRSGAKLISLD